MQSIITKIVAFAIAFSCVGCSGFLDRDPLDQLSESSFYKTASDAQKAAISMYAHPQSVGWYGTSWKILEIPTDNTTSGGNDPDFSPIDNFTHDQDNGPILDFWREHFRLVVSANQILKFVPEIEMESALQESILGEASFMRAFAYFDLVRIYGDVPIITIVPDINTTVEVQRDPVSQVYEFIIADLQLAIASLPNKRTDGDAGRASADAARALLAKVYLTLGENDSCIDLCNELISSSRYRLMDTYDENWLRESSDNNAEAIWQISYIGCGPGGTGNASQAFFAPWGQNITGNSDGWGSQIPTAPQIDNPGTTAKDIFKDGDLRKYHSIMTPLDEYPMINADRGGYIYPAAGASRAAINIKKYVIGGGADVCFMSTPQNIHVIRYADVLLMLAEASCARNGGITVTPEVIDAYNSVRERAGLPAVGVVTSDEVLEERRKEFAFENERWFDLLRSGKILDIMVFHGKGMKEHHKLFPIPATEIAINPLLSQNPGY